MQMRGTKVTNESNQSANERNQSYQSANERNQSYKCEAEVARLCLVSIRNVLTSSN